MIEVFQINYTQVNENCQGSVELSSGLNLNNENAILPSINNILSIYLKFHVFPSILNI